LKPALATRCITPFALLAVAWLVSRSPSNAALWAGRLFLLGTVLFSGSLYLIALTGIGRFGLVTPFGAWRCWPGGSVSRSPRAGRSHSRVSRGAGLPRAAGAARPMVPVRPGSISWRHSMSPGLRRLLSRTLRHQRGGCSPGAGRRPGPAS
jgi:hypothetical protein